MITEIVMSNMQFYINFYSFFFPGISDHDSVKLCYGRSQMSVSVLFALLFI